MGDLISRSGLEAAIKRQYCTDCNNYDEARCRACCADDMLDLVDDMVDAGLPCWIPVKEKLPKDGEIVLFGYANNQFVCEGYLDRDEMDWCNMDDIQVRQPTHWMPLPEPPKEDD